MKRRIISILFSVLLSFTAIALTMHYNVKDVEILTSIPFYLLSVGCSALTYGFLMMKQARAKRYGCVFAFAFVLAQIIGLRIESYMSAGGLSDWLRMIMCTALLMPAVAFPAAKLLTYLEKHPESNKYPILKMSDRKYFLICLAVIAACYEVVHLAYFPILTEYDSGYQLFQSWNHLYSASNPLMHTFILGRFYLISQALFGVVEPGLYLFGLCQITLVAGTVSYGLTILRSNGCPHWLLGILIAFFAINPTLAILSISCTKDVPFYALLVLQLLMVYNGFRIPEKLSQKGYLLRLAIVTVMACLMRANMIVAMFILFPVVLLGFKGKKARRILSVFLIICVLFAYGTNALLITINNAEGTEIRESFNIPIAQLSNAARVYPEVNERLKEEGLIESDIYYSMFLVDLAKWNFNINKETLGTFMQLWKEYAVKYPVEYIDAFLWLNRGYWDIEDTTHARVYGDGPDSHCGILPSRVDVGIETIHHTCLLPTVYDFMEKMFSENKYLQVPILRELLSPALYCWLLFLALLASVYLRRWEIRGTIRMMLFLFIGVMMGPCCIMRYALGFILYAPLCFGLLFSKPLAAVEDACIVIPPVRGMIISRWTRLKAWMSDESERVVAIELNETNRAYRVIARVFLVLSGAALAYIVVRCCFGYSVVEMNYAEITANKASWPMLIGALILVGICIGADRLIRRVPSRTVFAVMALIFLISGVTLVARNDSYMRSDMLSCLWAARDMNYNEYSYLQPGMYLNVNQHQLGLVTLERIAVSICHGDLKLTAGFCACMNIIFILITFGLFRKIMIILAPRQKQLRKWITIALIGFVPQWMTVLNIYGHVPGFMLMMTAVYGMVRMFALSGKEPLRIRIHLYGLTILSIVTACWVRNSYLIGAGALLVATVLMLIRKKSVMPLIAVVIAAVLFFPVRTLTLKYYSNMSGQELNGGKPAVLWVADGLEEGNGNRAFGWNSGCGDDIFINKSNCDPQRATEIANETIRNRQARFAGDPGYAAYFFERKLASTWCNPSFLTVGHYESDENSAEDTGFEKLSRNQSSVDRYNLILSAPMFLVYLFALLGIIICLIEKRMPEPIVMLIYIYFLCGFLVYMIWETNPMYVYTCFIALIPAAALGAANCRRFIIRRIRSVHR